MNSQTLEPLSREYLQNIYQQTQEEIRKRKIKICITSFYNAIKTAAQTSNKKLFVFYLNDTMNNNHQLFKEYRDEILLEIQQLFPDSKVYYSNVVVGKDNSIHNIQDIDEKLKPFLNMNNIREALIVDWS